VGGGGELGHLPQGVTATLAVTLLPPPCRKWSTHIAPQKGAGAQGQADLQPVGVGVPRLPHVELPPRCGCKGTEDLRVTALREREAHSRVYPLNPGTFAQQALYGLSHTSTHFALVILDMERWQRRRLNFFSPGWPRTAILPISASQEPPPPN
jgi:hypothetical protein